MTTNQTLCVIKEEVLLSLPRLSSLSLSLERASQWLSLSLSHPPKAVTIQFSSFFFKNHFIFSYQVFDSEKYERQDEEERRREREKRERRERFYSVGAESAVLSDV